MIITKEQQEAWLDAYVKEKHTTDECIGFIDGIEKTLSFVQEKMNPKYDREKLIRQLFQGKVSDIIGNIKTIELLQESIIAIDKAIDK